MAEAPKGGGTPKGGGIGAGNIIGLIGDVAGTVINSVNARKIAKDQANLQKQLGELDAETRRYIIDKQASAQSETEKYQIAMQSILAQKFDSQLKYDSAPVRYAMVGVGVVLAGGIAAVIVILSKRKQANS